MGITGANAQHHAILMAHLLRKCRLQLAVGAGKALATASEIFLENQNMRKNHYFATVMGASLATAFAVLATPSYAADEEAARALARENNCFKCHALKKDKDGPAWSKVAEKYKGKPDAEAKLIHHITSGEMAKFPDGHEEKHKIVKTDPPNDQAQIKNLIDWILSL